MIRVSIKEACNILGVSQETLRRWHKLGKLIPEITVGGHRRYRLDDIKKVETKRTTYCYARVSTRGQKEDLDRQISILESFAAAKGYSYKLLQDIGSGINFKKPGLKLLIEEIENNKVDKIVITNKDRLVRFGFELIQKICELHSTTIEIINESVEIPFEQELAKDIIEIITVFSAKLYGKRSHKNKTALEELIKKA